MDTTNLFGVKFYEISYLVAIVTLPVAAVYHFYIYIAVLLLAYVCYKVIENKTRCILDINGKAVLITGCDTGFGHHLAKRLDDHGFIVYAGVLNANGDGANTLVSRKSKKLHVLKLDVTNDDDVTEAANYVNKQKTGLWGIVNNAGFNIYGDVELATIGHYHTVINCNLYGQIRLTKAFLPLLRKSKGRIVNTSSVMGLYACPSDSIYHVSKAGVEALTECLRFEMIKFGVGVSVIEPGWYDKATSCCSPAQRIKSNLDEMWDAATEEVRSVYGRKYLDRIYNGVEDGGKGDAATSPDPVLAAMEDALINEKPRYRYLIGGSSRWVDPAAMLARLYPILPDCISRPLIVWFFQCSAFPKEETEETKKSK